MPWADATRAGFVLFYALRTYVLIAGGPISGTFRRFHSADKAAKKVGHAQPHKEPCNQYYPPSHPTGPAQRPPGRHATLIECRRVMTERYSRRPGRVVHPASIFPHRPRRGNSAAHGGFQRPRVFARHVVPREHQAANCGKRFGSGERRRAGERRALFRDDLRPLR
jgi:hypothetical protein